VTASEAGETGDREVQSDRSWARAAGLTTVAAAAATIVVALYIARASALIAYPWDWSPSEGLFLDYARRTLEAPQTLYSHRVVPLPSAYGPLLPLLMAPIVALPAPLSAARLMSLAWTLLGAAAVAALLHRRAGLAWALAGVALYLAPMDLTFWHMLVRVDGPMQTLWLWAAVVLLPAELARGADSLSVRRTLAGTTLLLAGALVKPTAVLHGAPLVLGWFIVDRRSAWRLAATVGTAGLASLVLLQGVTHGAYLWVMGLYGLHPSEPGLVWANLAEIAVPAWPVVALAVAAGVWARRAGAAVWREPTLLLLVGGLAAAPLLGKSGASWNYALPALAATVLLAGCWSARSAAPARAGLTLAASLCAVGLAFTRTFPLPSASDEVTARAFYTFVVGLHERERGPILVARPDLAYFLTGEPEEIEGSSFQYLVAGNAPGVEDVLSRIRDGRYVLLVETWPLPPIPDWRRAIARGYREAGTCTLGWYFGRTRSEIYVRRDLPYSLVPPPGTRCAPEGEERP
jgi:hypothetical protein